MDSIFTLTVISAKRITERTRTWVWFRTLEEAIDSVTKSADFYFEIGYYDLCVIEEVEPRSIGPHRQMAWFCAEYDHEGGVHTVTRLDECPQELRHIVNWSMG